jgi:hypothetical protein
MQVRQTRCYGAPASPATNDRKPDFFLEQTRWNLMVSFAVGFGSGNCGHGRSRIRQVSVAASPDTCSEIPLSLRGTATWLTGLGRALDGSVMTREELAKDVGRITGCRKFAAKLAEGSWGTILKPAAFRGHLCFGPSRGQLVCFTRPGSWLKEQSAALDPQTATGMVARRFLAAYGPATCHDLARWWGGSGVSTARQWIAALGEEVSLIDLEGTQAWMLAADVQEIRDFQEKQSARLLPAFDQYVVAASRHAERLLPGNFRSRVYRPQGWISPVLLVNGHMEGTWRHTLKGNRIEVVIEPFVKVPQWARRGAEQEAGRLADFFASTLQLKWKE